MTCGYERYIRTGGVSGRMTAARQAELLALHREHHAATCRTRCRACGAEDCASAACLRGILAAEETAMRLHERFDYSAIVDRPRLKLPRGARLVVWPVVNVEEWDIARPMPRGVSNPPGGVSVVPDIQNWGWHEYGMRVGVWRFFDLYKRLGVRPTLSLNARVCVDYERVAKDFGRDVADRIFRENPRAALESQEINAEPPVAPSAPRKQTFLGRLAASFRR